jgi:plasmid stabilization system protein ParE
MAQREITWTRRAFEDKISIMEFWFAKTGFTDYSMKLENLFNSTLSIIKHLPRIGPLFDEKRNIRFVVVKDNKIYYTFSEHEITVLAIWDTRRNRNTLDI